MPTLELPEAPPRSIACGTCGKEMRLVSVVPIAQRTVHSYQCANGHRHKIVRANKKSSARMTNCWRPPPLPPGGGKAAASSMLFARYRPRQSGLSPDSPAMQRAREGLW